MELGTKDIMASKKSSAPKTRAKKVPTPSAVETSSTEASVAATETPVAAPKTAIKVLKNGRNSHCRNIVAYPLPTQNADGTWAPGAWTASERVEWCQSGWHLTRDPGRWWGDGEGVIAYLAEYDGATAGPNAADDDSTKFAAERVRLLRPLTRAELEAHGIYLTGEHEELSEGRLIVGGDARVKRVAGSARIDRMYGSARIDRMDGSARIDWMYGSARIDRMYGSARIDRMYGSARIDWMYGSARIDRMYGSARIDWMDGIATAHASGEALVVVRGSQPTVTLRRNASVLDYRSGRPVHRLASEGQVLTLAPDRTVSEAPESA